MKKNISLLLAICLLVTSTIFVTTSYATPFKYNPDSYSKPTTSIKVGSKGDGVRWVQAILANAGYPIDVDGSYGNGSAGIVKRYQRDNDLGVDGNVGPATRASLADYWDKLKHEILLPIDFNDHTSFPEPKGSVRVGMQGFSVYWVQALLYELGYSISVDGSFGNGTANVVKKFQKDYGLSADGNVGPATKAKMLAVFGAGSVEPEESGVCGDPGTRYEFYEAQHLLKITGVGEIRGIYFSQVVIEKTTKIEIADTITGMYYQTFKNFTGITEIHLSGNLTYMGYRVFDGCTNLKKIYIDMERPAAEPLPGWNMDWKGGNTATVVWNEPMSNPDDYSMPFNTVKGGTKGNDAYWVQSILENLGYTITVDGSYGNGTASTVKQFQSKNGISADGTAGLATIVALHIKWCEKKGVSPKPSPRSSIAYNADEYLKPSTSIRSGSSGEGVRWVQAILFNLGYPMTVDGSYGAGSIAVVKLFQRVNGLDQDGNVGPATRSKLESEWKSLKSKHGISGKMPYQSYEKNISYTRESHHSAVSSGFGGYTYSNTYYIKVNLNAQLVYVYKRNSSGNPTGSPVKTFITSTGLKSNKSMATPVTKFVILDNAQRGDAKYRWCYANPWVQYATRLYKVNSINASSFSGYFTGFMFHSELYTSQNENTLITDDYNMLGYPRSHGCMRMRAVDAKWIYDNCHSGTVVEIIDGTPDTATWATLKAQAGELPAGTKRDPSQP